MRIKITIEGRCKSKANNNRGWVPAEYKKYERFTAWQAHQQMKRNGWKIFNEPIFIVMRFYFKPGIRLDLTNCPKSCNDGLNGVLYKDDRLIHKCYLEMHTDVNERIEIEAWNIAETQETLLFENSLNQNI